jgi:hypothetical protein
MDDSTLASTNNGLHHDNTSALFGERGSCLTESFVLKLWRMPVFNVMKAAMDAST